MSLSRVCKSWVAENVPAQHAGEPGEVSAGAALLGVRAQELHVVRSGLGGVLPCLERLIAVAQRVVQLGDAAQEQRVAELGVAVDEALVGREQLFGRVLLLGHALERVAAARGSSGRAERRA